MIAEHDNINSTEEHDANEALDAGLTAQIMIVRLEIEEIS